MGDLRIKPFLEECDVCEVIRPCELAFCIRGHRHHVCLPCGKAAQAHGQAIEARFAVSAVDLSPENYGGKFINHHGY